METVSIYLAGGMGSLSFEEQSKWRNQIMNAIKFGDYDYEKKPIFTNPVDYYNFEEKRHKSENEIMEFDLNRVRKSDLIIVNFNDPSSIGTSMEIAIAKELHIPIVGINVGNKRLHPWLECSCMRMCENLREAVEYTVVFFLN